MASRFAKRTFILLATLIFALVGALLLGCHRGGGDIGDNPGDDPGIEQPSSPGSSDAPETEPEPEPAIQQPAIDEDGSYTSKEDVALYIHTYGHLPSNYITKQEAQDAGWHSSENNLGKACPGKSIGGDHFGNYEKRLPTAKGRKYYECDIDTKGKSRGAKRIVYSNDGLVFYTEDHYESFEQLY
ncbi:MAG: ribonuclease [bacterium]|nr:ribonuclease [bacterium]